MNKEKRQVIVASASLMGAIMGVGIFGVPYVLSRVGLLPALAFFLVLGAIQVIQHLFFVETAIVCKEPHGLPGLFKLYLGRRPGKLGGAALVLGYWCSMTAYVVVGGDFLAVILQPMLGGSVLAYTLIWSILAALVVRFGMKIVSEFEVIGTVGLLLALFGIIGFALPKVTAANLPAVTGIDWIMPYGVILFSMAGLTAISEMEEMVEGRPRDYRLSVIVGTVAAGLMTLAFGLVVWGVNGMAVTEDAVTGLKSALGSGVAVPVAIAGFLAIATSYFATALNLKNSFAEDFKFKVNVSWLLAVGPPILIFLMGGRDFLGLVGFSGAVFGGIIAVLVGFLYLTIVKLKLVKKDRLGLPAWMAWVTIVIFSVGAAVGAADYIKDFLT